MRTYVKKKLYSEHVRSQVLAGLVNHPSGLWANGHVDLTEKCKNFSLAGTMGKRRRKGR